jgi:hypothetical protein
MGRKKDGCLMEQVILPKWAHDSPHIYAMKNRLFLNDMVYFKTRDDGKMIEDDFCFSQNLE